MKTLTLNLIITNGKSLTSIVFALYKSGISEPIFEGDSKESFSRDFNLENNTEYKLYISGSNPISEKKSTKIKLVYDRFTFHGDFKNPIERRGEGYFIKYAFNSN